MAQTCWCICLPVYQNSFFPPIFVLMSLFCQECSVLVPWVLTETGPSLGLKVQKVSAQNCSPVKEWRSSWSAELSAWWPPLWSQGKNWDRKPSSPKCLSQHTHWNPWAAAVRGCSSGVGFGSPLAEGRHWWPSQAHRWSGHWAVRRLCVQLPPCVGRIVTLLFFRCDVVRVPSPVQAELNSQKADLCWAPLCPHCGLHWVLVVLPRDFYP